MTDSGAARRGSIVAAEIRRRQPKTVVGFAKEKKKTIKFDARGMHAKS